MKLSDYEGTGQTAYAGLAQVVARILTAAVAQDHAIRTQSIQHRAKELDSLKRKLAKAEADEACEIEVHAKDLAGARVIFYTNSDVGQFQNSGILTDNFEVDWDRTKFHHPTSDTPEASELFVSNNYVVRLKEDRAALPEYRRYAGMWCEVQVQTALNHAWAEMAHDTIYKKPEIVGFGGDLMQGIEARMKGIMHDYLAPAGYAFQKVLSDFDRLSRGQALFEQGIVAAIEQAEDKNALHETLQKFANSVLPYFDDYDAAYIDILNAVVAGVKRSRTMPVRVRETPFGNLEGKTSNSVATVAASIIRELRFMDVERTFDVICDLYREADEAEAVCWVKLAGELAEHNLTIWEQSGPVVQFMLIERVQAMSEEDRLTLKPIILAVLQRVFATELQGTTSNLNTITIHRGAVVPSDALGRIRQIALDFLIAYDLAVVEGDEQAELLKLFSDAMAMPSASRSSNPELATIVYGNAAQIIRHLTAHVNDWSYEQRQKTEHKLLWKYRNHGAALTPESTSDVAEQARADMVAAIREFRGRVNADEGYTTYKLLVGFQSVFPPAWDDPNFHYKQEEAYRSSQIDLLIAGITSENSDHWLAIIRRCAATKSNDLATFPTFHGFLQKLAVAKPAIVLNYLGQLDERLANFLPSMLFGLSQGTTWPDTEALLRAWIARGWLLSDLAWSVGTVEAMDLGMLRDILTAGIAADEELTVLSSIRAIAWRDSESTAPELKPMLVDATAYMARSHEPRWVNYWLSRRDHTFLIASLTEDEAVAILDSLVRSPRVGSDLEWFLADIAKAHPVQVIGYFGKRIAKRFEGERDDQYDAVPYDLDRLVEVLSGSAQEIVTAARSWFGTQPDFFSYYGGKLIEVLFPAFSPELETALRRYVGPDREDTKFVLETLRAYSGEPFLQPLGRDIVAVLAADDPLLTNVEIAMEPSGVTTGEFGRVERLKAHRETILSWATDEREPVRLFAERYAHQLDNSIKAEQRRSEESAALQRLEYERLVQPPTHDGGAATASEA